MVRITKVYTKTGDDGYTSLMDGKRYSKASPKFAAMGDIDTLNAQIGWCRQVLSAPLWQDMDQQCARIQQELFDVGAMLCVPPSQRRADTPAISMTMEAQLEHSMDAMQQFLPALSSFILPGGGEAAARLHVARAACRAAERCLVACHNQASIDVIIIQYINRLSDWLFVAARTASVLSKCPEALWQS